MLDLKLNLNISYFQVNCQWSSWSETGPCSKSCGGGIQYFERTIVVESQNGGQSCDGRSTKSEFCKTQKCRKLSALHLILFHFY